MPPPSLLRRRPPALVQRRPRLAGQGCAPGKAVSPPCGLLWASGRKRKGKSFWTKHAA